jgi:hypothetical protein
METRSRMAASALEERLVRSLCRQRTLYVCEIRAVIELAWSWDEQEECKIGNIADIRSKKEGRTFRTLGFDIRVAVHRKIKLLRQSASRYLIQFYICK